MSGYNNPLEGVLTMGRHAIQIGGGLVVLGLGGYFASGQTSPTALIPTGFGAIIMLLGMLAKKTGSSKHPMHIAAVLALVGVLGSANGFVDVYSFLSGAQTAQPLAAVCKSLMAVLLTIFLILCIRSFRAARKAREDSPQLPG